MAQEAGHTIHLIARDCPANRFHQDSAHQLNPLKLRHGVFLSTFTRFAQSGVENRPRSCRAEVILDHSQFLQRQLRATRRYTEWRSEHAPKARAIAEAAGAEQIGDDTREAVSVWSKKSSRRSLPRFLLRQGRSKAKTDGAPCRTSDCAVIGTCTLGQLFGSGRKPSVVKAGTMKTRVARKVKPRDKAAGSPIDEGSGEALT
jgi:hypothetical protein